ncbi:LysR family transcriptional regulator [Pseudomonas sp. LRF_L74]|uniref:LysR family transcriptional regulator n=1 Tax=Pseudomonas sp. LRF_L74 TaxID=3369422 RepID=UPI003F60139E
MTKLRSLDLNLLVTLEVLLEERSVSRSAVRLGIGQAAVSTQLAHLRKYFDDALFISSGRGITPTSFASGLSDPLRELMQQTREFLVRRQTFDQRTTTRRFRIRAGDIDTFLLISKLNQYLLREAPGVQVSLVAGKYDLRRVDFHIMPSGLHDENLPMKPLYMDRYVCLISRDNELFGQSISEREYFDATHIVRRSGLTGTPSLEALQIKRMGYQRHEGPVVDAYASIPFMLVNSPYITTVPLRFAEEMTRLFALRILELPIELPEQTLVLQWNPLLEGDMAAVWFREQFFNVAQSIYGPLPDQAVLAGAGT